MKKLRCLSNNWTMDILIDRSCNLGFLLADLAILLLNFWRRKVMVDFQPAHNHWEWGFEHGTGPH